MPCLYVPIQREFWWSENNASSPRVLPSNPGTTNGFQAPCASCCNPRPRPAKAIPTQREPSELATRLVTPSIPRFDFNPLKLNLLNVPDFQRTTSAGPPIQRLPRVSSTRVPTPGEFGIPSSPP